ncbi:MAG: hypothetical protein K0V04_05865 [Deltaproteobacteria bacterium]|nr:hypothetical protein [Deltaproteobacteria bacterium]
MGSSGDSSASTTARPGADRWCPDMDGDGFGAPEGCRLSPVPIAGYVTNADDCDDAHDQTFPGAAQLEPTLCARDADNDRWGDDTPPAGVDAGTDCDDDHGGTFPGAARNETTPEACARDDDDDGWADANPGPGIEAGADCFDTNADLRPDAMLLTTLLPSGGGPGSSRTLATIDTQSANVADVLTLLDPTGQNPNVSMGSATLAADGTILASDITGAQLLELEYQSSCAMGTGTLTVQGAPNGMPGVVDDIMCGLQRGPGGMLYGISLSDELHTLDPVTGQITSSVDVVVGGQPVDVFSCGMAYDCAEDVLLLLNGADGLLYEVQTDGTATVRVDLTGAVQTGFSPTALEYDPVAQQVFISTGGLLWTAPLDGTDTLDFVGFFGQPVPTLQFLPVCN